MIIGNKCDLEDKRVVPIERGQEVCFIYLIHFNLYSKILICINQCR